MRVDLPGAGRRQRGQHMTLLCVGPTTHLAAQNFGYLLALEAARNRNCVGRNQFFRQPAGKRDHDIEGGLDHRTARTCICNCTYESVGASAKAVPSLVFAGAGHAKRNGPIAHEPSDHSMTGLMIGNVLLVHAGHIDVKRFTVPLAVIFRWAFALPASTETGNVPIPAMVTIFSISTRNSDPYV